MLKSSRMARSTKSFAELFLPRKPRRSPSRRPASIADSPAIQAIWDVVGMIPRGTVSTYGAVARAAGLPATMGATTLRGMHSSSVFADARADDSCR